MDFKRFCYVYKYGFYVYYLSSIVLGLLLWILICTEVLGSRVLNLIGLDFLIYIGYNLF